MESTGTKRRLAAIMMADVVGYSRLMGDDEAATVRTLKAYRELFAAQVAGHDGRVVNTPGDSILAEFGSVVDAVAAAVEWTSETKHAMNQFYDVEIVRLHSLTPRRGEPQQDTVTAGPRKGADRASLDAFRPQRDTLHINFSQRVPLEPHHGRCQ